MRVVGLVARVGVLAVVALVVATASASARLALPSFGWISSGVSVEGGSGVLVEASDGSISVTTMEGLEHLYMLGDVRRGGVSPVLMGSDLVRGSDGALWEARESAIVSGDSEVLRISGEVVTRELLLEGAINRMAAGLDGAVWVVAQREGVGHLPACAETVPQSAPCVPSIVKLAPGAAAEFFPLPSSMESQRTIAAGADGDLWFGARMNGGNGIARMTPAGEFHYWRLYSTEEASGLASGPSGMWFTLGPEEVGRVSYGGRLSLFSQGIPAGAYPDGITQGADGAMWFTQRDANAIGRVDASGHVTEMPWGKLIISEQLRTPDGAESIVSAAGRSVLFYRPGREEFGRLSIDGRCVVSSLVGYELDKIARWLRRAGCRLAMRKRHQGRGRVIAAQRERPGTLLARGATISVRTVSQRVAAKRCIPSPAQRKVIGDRQFVLVSEPGEREPPVWRTRYLACVYGADGMHTTKPSMESLIANWGDGGSYSTFGPLVVAGPYLAWQTISSSGSQMSSTTITVLDVPEDKEIAEQKIGSSEAIYGSDVHTIQLVLDPEGRVAWRAKIFTYSASPQVTEAVEIIGEGGELVVLESGPPGSFGALSFGPVGTLHWSSNGAARTYTFPTTGGG